MRENHYGIYIPSGLNVSPGKEYLIPSLRKVNERNLLTNGLLVNGIDWREDSSEELKALLNPSVRKLIDDVVNFVYFDSCISPYSHLYYRLCALSELGLQAVEFQGKHNKKGEMEWVKAYGFRGTRE